MFQSGIESILTSAGYNLLSDSEQIHSKFWIRTSPTFCIYFQYYYNQLFIFNSQNTLMYFKYASIRLLAPLTPLYIS
jgi:hypothetical protein